MSETRYRTAQEMFDVAAGHLLRQGTRSTVGSTELCAYRGSGGLKCAIGALIPDRLYSPHMEGRPAYADDIRSAAGIGPCALALATSIQFVHDDGDTRQWADDLQRVAREHGLDDRVVREWLAGTVAAGGKT